MKLPRRMLTLALVVALVVGGCGDDRLAGEDNEFGPVLADIDEIIGTEITASEVVDLPCIPSRRDPVGVWLGLRVVEFAAAEVEGEPALRLEIETTDARLGSHPSGCSNPALFASQSVFLYDGTDALFSTLSSTTGDRSTAFFELDDRPASDYDLVILPTLAFDTGDGNPQTTIFGLIGRYSINHSPD